MYQEAPSNLELEIGEVYLFHSSDPSCPCDSSIWGVFDKMEGSTIYLESHSLDLRYFRLWSPLPIKFRYVRLATRSELRDYIYNLAAWESTRRR